MIPGDTRIADLIEKLRSAAGCARSDAYMARTDIAQNYYSGMAYAYGHAMRLAEALAAAPADPPTPQEINHESKKDNE